MTTPIILAIVIRMDKPKVINMVLRRFIHSYPQV